MSDRKETGPRTFLSPGYVKILERNLYGLFRNVEIEEWDEKAKRRVREKVKEVGPIRLLREAQKGEEARVVLRTHHPVENRPLDLVEVE